MNETISKNVNLSKFVSESLKQIIDGIVTAQEYANSKGALINPYDYAIATNLTHKILTALTTTYCTENAKW
jgi:hypothetical protein